MNWSRSIYTVAGAVLALILCHRGNHDLFPAAKAAQPQQEPGLIIVNDSRLPEGKLLEFYEVQFLTRSGVPPMHWQIEKGTLPPGIVLEPNGRLRGVVHTGGEFHFTVTVRDSSNQHAQKDFVIPVPSAMELKWKSLAHVEGKRIDGSVEVSNTTPDDIDLTFVVLAVAPNGRATAIGYQHFPLRRGTIGQELPFGDTLARGEYVVHVDAVGEVISKKVIYREHLETHALNVAVGP